MFVIGVRTDGDLSQVRGHIMTVNDEPVISVADGGIFCLRATLAGHYKCYRQVVFTTVMSLQSKLCYADFFKVPPKINKAK